MRMSKLFVQTLREYPADAEVVSHKLLVKAGFIRKLAGGIYNYLPLMQRVLKKIENIVREEMDNAGAQEMLMPFVQPKELWEASGRWNVYGRELMRLKDRHDREMCLGPTHEEIITAVARDGLKSYKQLPINLYQIQSKFRDEIRPRFGLLRGREFIMKDAYSFGASQKDLDNEYKNMAQTYKRIFDRCALPTKMVQSDSGAIGGSVSHEFMVLTNTDAGENDVFYCDNCAYAANSNHAVSKLIAKPADGSDFNINEKKIVDTPNTRTIEELSNFLNIPASIICKCIVYVADGRPILALIRGDKQVEATKLMNAVNANEIRIAESDEIENLMKENGFCAKAGFIGAIGINNVKIIADETIKGLRNFVTGVNQNDKHLIGASLEDIKYDKFCDIRQAEAGDLCPNCGKELNMAKGIEVGNIFQLGTKYSKPMNALYLDKDGKAKPYIMGCYGIGITRTAAAAVEAHHDEHGIKWPVAIAPYHTVIIPVNTKDELQKSTAESIYNELKAAGYEVVIDDRDDRAGVKFKDADLIGFPYKIIAGKTAAEGKVELIIRETGEKEELSVDNAIERVKELITSQIN